MGETKEKLAQIQKRTANACEIPGRMRIFKALFREYPDGHNQSQRNIKKLMDIHKEYPKTPETKLGTKTHEAISRMMLKYPDPPAKKTRTKQDTKYNAKHAKKCFSTYKGRNQHQKRSSTCQQQIKPNQSQYLCPNDGCRKLSKTDEQREKHLTYHCHEQNTLKEPNKLGKKKKRIKTKWQI